MNLERVKNIPNGEKVVPTFSTAEMERRLLALRKHMADDGLDAVVFTSYHNMNYYSDFLYTAFGRPYALVVTPDSATTVSANIDAGMPWRRTFGDNVVYTDWRRDNFEYAVQQVLAEQGISQRSARRRGGPHQSRSAGSGSPRRFLICIPSMWQRPPCGCGWSSRPRRSN